MGKRLRERRRSSAAREAELRAVIDAAPLAIAFVAPDMEIHWANEPLAELLGCRAAQLCGRSLVEVLPQLAPDELVFRRAAAGDAASGRQIEIAVDGIPRYFEVSYRPVRLATASDVAGVVAILRDCTLERCTHLDRETAVKLARDSEERWQSFVMNVPDFICTARPDGTITFMNRPRPSALGNKLLYDFVLPEDRDEFRARCNQVLETGRPVQFESRCGIEDQVSSRHIGPLFQGGKTTGLILIARDVTERVRTEQQLRSSQERFRQVLEAAMEAITIHDRDGRLLETNRRACELLGCSETELAGLRLGDLDISGRAESLLHQVSLCSPQTAEGAYRGKNGRIVPVEMRLSVLEGHGDAHQVAVLARDISDRKRLEEMRTKFIGRVMDALEGDRRRIAQDLHDEIGQLLTSLDVQLRSAEEAAGDADLRDRVRRMRKVSERALGEVSQLAHGLRTPVLDRHGLFSAVREYANEFGRSHGLDVEIQLRGMSGEERFPSAVETVLYRIAQEALTNVVKHARASSVRILLDRRADSVRLVVEDDGRGCELAAADQIGIWKPGTSRALGLYGIQERAAQLHGTTRIESRPGDGFSLYVTVPLVQSPETVVWEPAQRQT